MVSSYSYDATTFKPGDAFLIFNAWENDFSENALVSLIGEIESQISTLYVDSKKQSKAREQLTQIKKVGASLIRKSLPVAVKIDPSAYYH